MTLVKTNLILKSSQHEMDKAVTYV